ncbi:MAG: hypothetical protein WCH39_18630 [Schlesneria sp.]
MTLTNEQRSVMLAKGKLPITVEGVDYVLVRTDVFNRLNMLLGEDWTYEEMRQALARSASENGWDERGMEAYDTYSETPSQ